MRRLGLLGVAIVMLTASMSGIAPHPSHAAPGGEAGATLEGLATGRDHERLVPVGTTEGPRGLTYHAYERTYRGLPVLGGDFVAVTDSSGSLVGTPLAGKPPVDVAVTPTVTPRAATAAARTRMPGATGATAPRLVVFAPDDEERLAYELVLTGTREGRPSRLHVIVDARSGVVPAAWDEVLDGTGHGYYYDDTSIDTRRTGSGYEMSDPGRRNLFCGIQGNGAVSGPDDSFGNGGGTDLETACADAYYAAQQEWNMLRDWLGRDGFDGSGGAFPLFVGLNAVNAYWNGHTVNIGRTKDNQRQLAELDVVAHEFGHSVFQFTPGGFDGYTETYALNEATGDIFGALTEHYANHPSDPPDYVYAEEADALGRGPERIMYDPSAGPRNEPNCWSTKIPDTEVHDAAGPANHFFYLMAEGTNPGGGKPSSPVCAGGPDSVTGLGIRTAGRIWMTALMQKTSFWEYADARVATLNAVTQLYPGDCARYDTVKGAWDAVSVPAQAAEPGRPGDCGQNPSSFSLDLTPVTVDTTPGATATSTVVTRTTSGDPQDVTLTASGLPDGATAAFDPPTVETGGSSVLTVSTAEDTPAGTHRITVTGTGTDGDTRSAALTLTVRGTNPDTCTGHEETRTGSLQAGATAYQPDGGYYRTSVTGTHRACLRAPDGADFGLALQKWSGRAWTVVAEATGPGTTLTHTGPAGYYRYRIQARTAGGDYTLGYDTP
ncbi:zinc metalloprotease [Streptomyces anthocyanicus]|uniref:M4 family metallopeptidase n=1 Tax=Streptomyces TaxID=1883 RepID=UPI001290B897|nr:MULTISPECIES: M4 family metallopeptidase [Streptomyces]MBQ0953070.1 M4 family metallopeptidase [Streptomyces sp. RK76]MDI6521612.1 M4 family metallopeptidase [Streptomyces coelicoflavus]QFX86830.1 peptidase M4 family protein [Streptomyces sp. SYP-A7193]GHC33920.1 zinc metalloprotease [Streptomyces anthocyanicus]